MFFLESNKLIGELKKQIKVLNNPKIFNNGSNNTRKVSKPKPNTKKQFGKQSNLT